MDNSVGNGYGASTAASRNTIKRKMDCKHSRKKRKIKEQNTKNKKPLLPGRRPILVQGNRGSLLSQEKPMQHSPGEFSG